MPDLPPSFPPLDGLEHPLKPEVEAGRPFGLYAIIGLQLLSAMVAFLAVYSVLTDGAEPGKYGNWQLYGFLAWTAGKALVQVVAAGGLWFRRYWAWVATMLLTGLTMGLDLLSYLAAAPVYSSMVISIAIVFYLNQRDVQQQFGTPGEGRAWRAINSHE